MDNKPFVVKTHNVHLDVLWIEQAEKDFARNKKKTEAIQNTSGQLSSIDICNNYLWMNL